MRARLLARAVLVVAVVVIAAGGVLAVRGWRSDRDDPDSVVRHYFAALRRGDSADALSYGAPTSGSRALLSDSVLRAQQRAAPLRNLDVLSTRTTGDRAVVDVGYVLDFSGGPTTVAADVALHRAGGGWLLDTAAIPTRFAFDAARERASFGGTAMPAGRVLVFPGAVALQFDSPYLTATVGNGSITFGAPASTAVQVALTAAGRRAARASVLTALKRCLARGGLTCPQPDERYLPGSVHGRLRGPLRDVTVGLTGSQVGVISVRARAAAGISYRRLDFTDHPRAGRSTEQLAVRAVAVATAPLAIRWTR